MIIDKITNLNQYFSGAWIEGLMSFYQTLSKNTPNGNYAVIENDLLFCKVMSYETKTEDFVTESHIEYIDFQILLEGNERLDIYEPGVLDVKKEYSKETDCIFYHFPVGTVPTVSISLKPGIVAVLLPQDAHATQISVESTPCTLKKIVFKVHRSLLNL